VILGREGRGSCVPDGDRVRRLLQGCAAGGGGGGGGAGDSSADSRHLNGTCFATLNHHSNCHHHLPRPPSSPPLSSSPFLIPTSPPLPPRILDVGTEEPRSVKLSEIMGGAKKAVLFGLPGG
jgi:hypothetical protein